MTTWLVSRHRGALEWLAQRSLKPDKIVPHLDPERVQSGDTVIGTLPVNLAGEVCLGGARYFHLSLRIPLTWRGLELTAAQLEQIGTKICEYAIQPLGDA